MWAYYNTLDLINTLVQNLFNLMVEFIDRTLLSEITDERYNG